MFLPTYSYSGMDPKLKEWVDDKENPSYNLIPVVEWAVSESSFLKVDFK